MTFANNKKDKGAGLDPFVLFVVGDQDGALT